MLRSLAPVMRAAWRGGARAGVHVRCFSATAARLARAPEVKGFFDPKTFTVTYVVWDAATKDAMVIDAVTAYCNASSTYEEGVGTAKDVVDLAAAEGLQVHYILETHAHADHLSGSQYLRKVFPAAQIGVGDQITAVQETFKAIYNMPSEFPTDGRQFDRLFKAHEEFAAGALEVRVLPTPGHTPACVSYVIGDAVFTGDCMFLPDSGTGRCDFPGGSSEAMYTSITEQLYSLPDSTRVFVGHDYQPGGRGVEYESTIAAQKAANIQLPAGRTEEEFVGFRSARDATLRAPLLLYPSIQVNIDAGRMPDMLKIPLYSKSA
eukprot:TRINITY_DN2713_c0_g3_i1.p1 TRINITY_DN2713_c0_g3~~TRINITY_DN2713_c0_g3_i1.p1  ORF type:complete len:320 (+),score=125.64 TRINITY_DN2713_c0_g3_i1:45-1004(+)